MDVGGDAGTVRGEATAASEGAMLAGGGVRQAGGRNGGGCRAMRPRGVFGRSRLGVVRVWEWEPEGETGRRGR